MSREISRRSIPILWLRCQYDTVRTATEESIPEATERIFRKAAMIAEGEAVDYDDEWEEYLDKDDGTFFVLQRWLVLATTSSR